MILGLCLVGLVITILYAVDAGRQVTLRMSGRLWELPSRIYAAPITLYPGVPILHKDLESYFQRMAYEQVNQPNPEIGQWYQNSEGYKVHLRTFQDAEGHHPSSTLKIEIQSGRVRTLEKFEREVFTANFEPELIGEFFRSHREERTIVRLSEVPQSLIDALLLMEDRGFYDHFGISFRGILRAFWSNLRGKGIRQGGSTLTQQLMKNFFLTPERTIMRKLRELVMTFITEFLYSKDQILEAYINEIYLGQRGPVSVHGFEEAAKFYFSKPLKYTAVGEQALLVGLVSSPGLYSPYNSVERARKRRDLVLGLLHRHEKISREEYEAALNEKIRPRGKKIDKIRVPYFLDFVRSEIAERFSNVSLTQEGYQIYTTLDPMMQIFAQQAVEKGMKAIEARVPKLKLKKEDTPKQLQVSFVVLHPQTGAIKAMIGGRDYKTSQFNRATQARRQPGSAMKPFVAATALSPLGEGRLPAATPSKFLDDRPATFAFSGQEWSPKNYDDVYGGTVTLREAIERSLNVATVNLATHVGVDRLVSMFSKFGFSKIPSVPSIALGALQVTPLELARAYTVFASGGLRVEPQGVISVVDQNGHRLEQRSLSVKRVLSEEVAFLVTNILQGVVNRGTARSARVLGLGNPLAGKTGTTNDYRDAWFIGYSPTLLAAAWVGYDEEQTTNFTGASSALQIWIPFMKQALRRLPKEKFSVPKGVRWVQIDPKKGCAIRKGQRFQEVYLKGTEPQRCQ